MSASERGVSLLAALVFVGILTGVAVGIQYVIPNSTITASVKGQSQVAEVGSATDRGYVPTETDATGDQFAAQRLATAQATAQKELAKKCDDAISQVKLSGKVTTSEKNLKTETDCVAVVRTKEPEYQSKGGLKCVGKSAQVLMNSDGTVSIDWQANPNLKVGSCSTKICEPVLSDPVSKAVSYTLGYSGKAKCVGARLTSIGKSGLLDALNSSDSVLYTRSLGGIVGSESRMTPNSPLSQIQSEIHAEAYGGSTSGANGSVPLDSNGNLQSPAYTEIEKYADANPNETAKEESRKITLNTDIEKTAALTPSVNPAAGCKTAACVDNNTNNYDGPKKTDTFTPGPGNGNTDTKGSGGLGDILGKMAPFLAALAKAFLQPKPPAPQACPTDPNQYAQYQQQYQTQLQQYNYQLQQYNYQQQLNSAYGGNGPSLIPPAQPTPCTPSTSQQCQSQPQQPPAQNCNAGSWKPTYNGSCVTNWQCVPNSSGAPTATLSCEPKVADAGMTLALSYSCSAGIAVGSGFSASTSPSGSATTTIAAPPAGTNTATYRLTCNAGGVTAGAQCSVQVAVPRIVLVANPKTVHSGETSLISWITTGMQSCIVSSPDDSSFTSRNSSNTSVAGAATTSPITAATNYLLHCQTNGGGVRDATTTVTL